MALQNGELTSHVKSVVTDYTKALNKKESVEHFIGPLAYIIVNGVAKCLDIVGVLRSTINNASKVEIDIVEEENYETSFPAGTTICTICFKTEVAVNVSLHISLFFFSRSNE